MRIRPERVAQLMRREIADILENEMRDPRISAMVSVTDVVVAKDLSFARVFVSVLAGEDERQRILGALQDANGFVRHALGPRLGLREVPGIGFRFDDSLEKGARVDEILRKIEQGEPLPDEDEA